MKCKYCGEEIIKRFVDGKEVFVNKKLEHDPRIISRNPAFMYVAHSCKELKKDVKKK